MSSKINLLEFDNISINFGGLKAVTDFTYRIKKDELVGLIGPNGAGKTTIFNILTGVYKATSGRILFENKDISDLKTHEINRLGIARTFQNIRLFKDLSVLDNVRIGFNRSVTYNPLEAICRLPKFFENENEITKRSKELLSIFEIEHKEKELAKNLPYGEQRKLEIVRALASKPKLLILDEPAAGMNPTETGKLLELVRCIRKEFNLTILLIEHDMSFVMEICERIAVLNYGQKIAEGTPDQIKSNKEVIKVYLGDEG